MLSANSAKAHGHLKVSAPSKLYGQAAIMHSADCGATGWPEVLTHLQASSGSASDEQRQVAEDTIADADADASGLWPGKVVTKISEAGPFWEAEAEDQGYLRHSPTARISSVRSRPVRDSRLGRG